MIVAVIALVAALGGTAVAAKQISLSALANGAKNKTVGVGKLTYVSASGSATVNDPAKTLSASCPSGTHVIGGGIKLEDPNQDFIADSYPTATGWTARFFVSGGPGETRSALVTAICGVSRSVTGTPPG
jgi:hypothetical protein